MHNGHGYIFVAPGIIISHYPRFSHVSIPSLLLHSTQYSSIKPSTIPKTLFVAFLDGNIAKYISIASMEWHDVRKAPDRVSHEMADSMKLDMW